MIISRLRTTQFLVLLAWSTAIAWSGEPEKLPLPASRTVTNLHGWTVRVDDRLFLPPHTTLGARALRLLDSKLADIQYVLPKAPLEKLKTITIVLDLSHGGLRTMQYHPSAAWLAEHGYPKELAKCVHIPNAANFATARQINEQPWVVLHELAHAYHDQVLGFDNPQILQAYARFQAGGHGEHVLLYNGTRTRHYALTNPKEFFAEFTESFFGLNDFFPFNRAELKTAQPGIYALMLDIWDPPQTATPEKESATPTLN